MVDVATVGCIIVLSVTIVLIKRANKWRRRACATHGGQYFSLLAFWHPAKPDGIARHTDGDALFQSTVLTSIAIDAHYWTLLVFTARPILDLLLNGAPEETLTAFAGMNAIVET